MKMGKTPTLVLLDLNLPDMSGTQILERLKSGVETKHVPVIVLTTTDDKAEVQKCYNLGLQRLYHQAGRL